MAHTMQEMGRVPSKGTYKGFRFETVYDPIELSDAGERHDPNAR